MSAELAAANPLTTCIQFFPDLPDALLSGVRMADRHRTTCSFSPEGWRLVKRELAHEQERRNLPQWLRPSQYVVLLAERQLLAQGEGRKPGPGVTKPSKGGRPKWKR